VKLMYINKFITNKSHLFIALSNRSQCTQLDDIRDLSLRRISKRIYDSIYLDAHDFNNNPVL
jgi:hypothetical protein